MLRARWKCSTFLDLLVETPSINGDESAADVIVDSIERVVNDDGNVMTRQGLVVNSSLGLELVYSIRKMMGYVSSNNGGTHT